jgi:crotonobetainyl-CoA:carnitine CoA-transferase CaiB-like acyl-CoA transferase
VQFELEETEDLEPTAKLGADTADIMRDLGYTDAQIDAAMADGSVTGATDLAVLQGKA